MNDGLVFTKANFEDLKQIADIENEYFENYEKKFDLNFLQRWYEHNQEMFYVVKNKDAEVLAFSILVPVKESLHKMLLNGEVSEFFDFDKSDVYENFDMKYVYLADICVGKSGGLRATVKLMTGVAKLIYDNSKYVTTTPVTKAGLKISKRIGFQKISEQKTPEYCYEVYGLDLENQKSKDTIYNFLLNQEKKINRGE